MVFPFFFFYHSLVAFEVIPLFLGSWWSVSLGLALVALLPFALPLALKTWRLHVPVVALALIATIYAVYYRLYGSDYQNSTEYFMYTGKLVIGWGGLYCLGLLMRPSNRFASITFWLVMAMVAVTPFLIQTEAYSLHSRLVGVAGYQYFAMAFTFTAIIAIGCNWKNGRDAIIVGVGLPTIFYLLARSELIGFFAVCIGWCVLAAVQVRWKAILVAFVAGAAVFAFIVIAPGIPRALPSFQGQIEKPLDELPAEPEPQIDVTAEAAARQAEAFDLGASPSWNYRVEYMMKGWEGIERSPIVGDYAGQVRDFNSAGAYIHNMLGVWRQFGIVAFIIYAGLCFGGAAFAVSQVVFREKTDPVWVLTAMVSGYVLVLTFGAKSVFWPPIALGWGMVAARLIERQLSAKSGQHSDGAEQ